MKFLYDWNSWFLKFMKISGGLWIIFATIINHGSKGYNQIPYFITLLTLLFLYYCASKKWYNGHPKQAGIGMHFQRSMVAGSYLFPLLAIANWWNMTWILWILTILSILVAHINVYLLAIHFKDKDKTNPQMYAGYH